MQANPGKVALIVAHENITSSCYLGDELEFMAANVVFRSGGTAAVLSSRWALGLNITSQPYP